MFMQFTCLNEAEVSVYIGTLMSLPFEGI